MCLPQDAIKQIKFAVCWLLFEMLSNIRTVPNQIDQAKNEKHRIKGHTEDSSHNTVIRHRYKEGGVCENECQAYDAIRAARGENEKNCIYKGYDLAHNDNSQREQHRKPRALNRLAQIYDVTAKVKTDRFNYKIDLEQDCDRL